MLRTPILELLTRILRASMFQMPTKRRENPLQLRIAASLDDAATVKYCSVKEVYLATSPEISGGGIVLILATSRGSLGKLEMEVI